MKKYKKIFIILLGIVILLACPISGYAAEKGEENTSAETTVNASQPRLMVTSYKVKGGYISPSGKTTLTIKLKNQSKTKAIKNLKLSVSEESGEVKPSGTGTAYIDSLAAGKTYEWTLEVTASKVAQTGEHTLTVSGEYEDKYYTAYTSSDAVIVTVRQQTRLDYSGVTLAKTVYQGENASVEYTLMNTGKSTIRNARLDFDVSSLESGGTSFVGKIAAGESKTGTANLRVASDKTGEVSGKAIISYEDEFGKEYTETVNLSATIKKKPAQKTQTEKKESKYKLWYVFLLVGAAAGGALGYGIPAAIRSAKSRKQDELRL